MKSFFGCLAGDLRRAFGSWLFWLAAAATWAACIIPAQDIIFTQFHYWGYWTLWEQSDMAAQGFYFFIFPVLGCLPFAASFCSDWNNRYIRSLCIRTGPGIYSISKITACALSGAAAAFLGRILFLLMCIGMTGGNLLQGIEEIGDITYMADFNGGFSPLLADGDIVKIFMYMLFTDLVKSLYAGNMAALALTVSAFLPNIFVTLSSPIIVLLAIEWVLSVLRIPLILHFTVVGNCRAGGPRVGGVATSLLYDVGFLVATTALFGCLFAYQIKRRLDRG